MVTIIDGKLAFTRDQVITSTQASKNFGEMRRRAREEPLYVSDRNDGIDTVIVSFDEFQRICVEYDALSRERLHGIAAQRIAEADADENHQPISLKETVGAEAYEAVINQDTESVPDSEVFA